LNWRLAQKLPANALAKVWAVPGNDFLCLFDLQIDRRNRATIGVTCDTAMSIHSDGLAVTFLSNTRTGAAHTDRVIVGIAPVGVRHVVAYTQGAITRIPVVGGVFMRRDKAMNPPDRVALGPVKDSSESAQ
jgi:hypothetical protein